jgi:hypothetical protein
MKAITVRPPWSWAIAHGGKLVENRTWSRTWRGQLAIHAGQRWDWDGADSPLVQQAWRDAGWDVYHLDPSHHAMTLGAIVAVADLVYVCIVQGARTDCDCGPWAVPGQCHWNLTNVQALAEPISCRGALGLWTLPDDVERGVRALAVPSWEES